MDTRTGQKSPKAMFHKAFIEECLIRVSRFGGSKAKARSLHIGALQLFRWADYASCGFSDNGRETSKVISMSHETSPNDRPKPIHQPLRAEEVNLEEWKAQEEEAKHGNPTINPGDRIDNSKTLEEKSQQVAVNAPDITGDHIVVPTYFIVEDEEGEQKALHHVKDAEEISDVIRQARMDEDGNRTWR